MKKIFLIFLFTLLASGCSRLSQDAVLSTVPPPVSQPTQPVTASRLSASSTPKQNSAQLLAAVNISGSTNTLPYTLSIYSDGSMVATVQYKKSSNFPPKTIDAGELSSLLNQAGNLNNVKSSGECAKSVSFGTVTTLTYNGQTSGDLQCIYGSSPAPYQNLADFVNSIVNKADIHPIRNPVAIQP